MSKPKRGGGGGGGVHGCLLWCFLCVIWILQHGDVNACSSHALPHTITHTHTHTITHTHHHTITQVPGTSMSPPTTHPPQAPWQPPTPVSLTTPGGDPTTTPPSFGVGVGGTGGHASPHPSGGVYLGMYPGNQPFTVTTAPMMGSVGLPPTIGGQPSSPRSHAAVSQPWSTVGQHPGGMRGDMGGLDRPPSRSESQRIAARTAQEVCV